MTTTTPETIEDLMKAAIPHLPLTDEEIRRAEESRRRIEAEADQAARVKRWAEMIPARFQWCDPASLTPAILAERIKLPRDRHGKPIPLDVLLPRLASATRGLCFMGPAGTGKTSLAVLALRRRFFAAPASARVLFVPARALATARIQHSAGSGEADIVGRAMRADLLLLDDVGNERQTANNAVPDVLLERHDSMRPTWCTTGFGADELAKLYGSGVARRILDGALLRFEVTP